MGQQRLIVWVLGMLLIVGVFMDLFILSGKLPPTPASSPAQPPKSPARDGGSTTQKWNQKSPARSGGSPPQHEIQSRPGPARMGGSTRKSVQPKVPPVWAGVYTQITGKIPTGAFLEKNTENPKNTYLKIGCFAHTKNYSFFMVTALKN